MAAKLVIVADDHEDSANMLALLLRIKTGARVMVAHDGGAAVELALAERPAVVILDLDMPVLDGVQAAQGIRRSAAHPLPLLISLSGNVQAVSSPDQAALFDHSLSKPVDMRRLLDILADVA